MHIPLEMSYQTVRDLSVFRRAAYGVVAKIPAGRVLTYGEVAARAGFPGAARAVGTAMGENRFRDVPCHRVVRADGQVGEYAFGGTQAKARRLRCEGVRLDGNRIIFPE